ncbi:MAG: phosphatidate cytidylyltransferase [Chitinophagaceae bacterium]|nr:phosphatidate cytidylyltransferase [Chitinophagaceae bacterium]
MAFNRQTFKTRALTAIVFVVVMLAGLLINHWSFLILFSIIHFGCWWEYLKLTEKIHKTNFHVYTKLGFMVMGFGLMLWFCGPVYQINSYSLKENLSLPVSAAGFALLLIGIFQKNAIKLKGFGMALLGLIYISLCWGFLISLWQQGIQWCNISNNTMTRVPHILIASIWINDTMAYIVGSFIGKTSLSKISPKKTWEGTIGGILLATIIVAFAAPQILVGQFYQPLVIFCGLIALIASVAGTFGDLFESKLKRMAGVKDSGSLMPGHGGFLDRFDSLLLATPAVWLYLYILVNMQ